MTGKQKVTWNLAQRPPSRGPCHASAGNFSKLVVPLLLHQKLSGKIAGGYLTDEDVFRELERASELNGYSREHGIDATRRTIRHGLDAGKLHPEHPQNRVNHRPDQLGPKVITSPATAVTHRIPSEPRLSFLSTSDCEMQTSRRYVIKGLLAEGDVGTIVGAPGAGKSLLAPYLGLKVAQGKPAFGRRTRQGGVFYVAAEDGLGMRGRVRALCAENGEADGFKLVAGVSDLLAKNSPDLKELLTAIKGDRPALIVVDTIAIAFPGLEENDAKSMGQVVAVARRLAGWGAAVLLIHHDTKDGSNGLPRGHSILNGALDMNLYLKRKDGVVTGKLTKNRNGSTDEKLAFTVATIQLGQDEDGDTITTALCREADAADMPKRKKLSRGERGVMDHFNELASEEGVSEVALRRACIDGRRVSYSDKEDSRRKTVDNALKGLTEKGVLIFGCGFYNTSSTGEYSAEDLL